MLEALADRAEARQAARLEHRRVGRHALVDHSGDQVELVGVALQRAHQLNVVAALGEHLVSAAVREVREEIGFEPTILKVLPLEYFQSPDAHFSYHTFVVIVPTEFIPVLSEEHKGYSWCSLDATPKPLHPGLYNSLNNKIIKEKLLTVQELLKIAF